MGLFEWLGQKLSTVLDALDPSITVGVLIFWAGGLYAMFQTPSLTTEWPWTVGAWTVTCMIAWGMAWEFRAKYLED
jgi:hypothetical protein